MDNAIRRINIHVGERNIIGIAMVVYAVHWSIIASKCLISLFQACNFQISVSKRYDFSFIVFAEIGDQLVPFPNRKITVW